MNHTSTPWHLSKHPDEDPAISGADGYVVASFPMSTGDRELEELENALRVVACVNACEGIADPSVIKDVLHLLNVAEIYAPADVKERIRRVLAKAEGK